MRDILLLRLQALLARAHGDAAAYAQLRDRYRDMARTLEFEGHIAWARQCHDGGKSGGLPTLSQNRRDTRLSKLCAEITVSANGPLVECLTAYP